MLISFTLNCCFSFCQESDSIQFDYKNERSFSKGWISSKSIMTLEYGISKYQLSALNDKMKTSFDSTFSNYLGCLGASITGSGLVMRKFAMDTHLDIVFYHSRPMVIEINDSSRYHIRGFQIGLDGCKDLFPKHNSIDLLIGLGFNTGRLVFANWDLTIEDKFNKKNKYTNPFFAPKLTIEPRIILFKYMSISIRAELQLDVTNQRWNIKNNSLDPIGGSAATGYSIRLALGLQ